MHQLCIGSRFSEDSLHPRAGGPDRPGEGEQLGNWTPIDADPEPLTRLYAAQDFSGAIAEIA